MFGKMVGRSSGARGLIPKSRGARIAMGAGVGSAAGGGLVLAMNNKRNSNNTQRKMNAMNERILGNMVLTEVTPQGKPIKVYDNRGTPSLQKHYDWQREGGATDAQAKEFIGMIRPGEDLSGLR